MNEEYKESLAFAEEKLDELIDLKNLDSNSEYTESDIYKINQEILKRKRKNSMKIYILANINY